MTGNQSFGKKDYYEAFVALTGSPKEEVKMRHLRVLFAQIGCDTTHENLELVMRMYDFDGNGKMNLNEFGQMMDGIYNRPDSDESLRTIFDGIDKDKGGYISRKEIAEALNDTEAGVKVEFERFDTKRDGKIDFDEFKKMYNSS